MQLRGAVEGPVLNAGEDGALLALVISHVECGSLF